jgi:hypothetical protein
VAARMGFAQLCPRIAHAPHAGLASGYGHATFSNRDNPAILAPELSMAG